MDLIFWRHADALESTQGHEDFSRELSSKGKRQAVRMGQWLDRQLPEGARIFCSPAVRAQETAVHLGRKFKTRDELSPQCHHADLMNFVQRSTSKSTVVLVGHQPLLGQTIAQLLGVNENSISMRKGSVWWLRCRLREGQPQGILWTVQVPELI